MNIFWKVLFVIFMGGLVFLGFAYGPISFSLLEAHKDWIGIVGSFASIAAALVGFFCWLFGRKNQTIENPVKSESKGSAVNITMTAGNDIIGRDKHEAHYHNGKIEGKD